MLLTKTENIWNEVSQSWWLLSKWSKRSRTYPFSAIMQTTFLYQFPEQTAFTMIGVSVAKEWMTCLLSSNLSNLFDNSRWVCKQLKITKVLVWKETLQLLPLLSTYLSWNAQRTTSFVVESIFFFKHGYMRNLNIASFCKDVDRK